MGRRRFAVVVYVPEPVRSEVDALRKAFGDASLHRIAPHVTLVPPVNVADEDVADAVSAVDAAAAGAEPFTVELGPPETFLPVTPVLYLHVGGEEARAALGGLRTRAFAAPLARPVGRDFEPHVTLGRARRAKHRIEAAITAFGDYRAMFTAGALTLVELLRPDDGPQVWTPVHESPLGGPAVVARGPMQLELSTTTAISGDVLGLLADEFGPSGGVDGGGTVLTGRRVEREPPPEQVVVTARRDGELLGAVVGRRSGRWHAVDAVAVTAAHRGQGIAGHLLRAFDAPR